MDEDDTTDRNNGPSLDEGNLIMLSLVWLDSDVTPLQQRTPTNYEDDQPARCGFFGNALLCQRQRYTGREDTRKSTDGVVLEVSH